jgi:hypothetical protein
MPIKTPTHEAGLQRALASEPTGVAAFEPGLESDV